MQQVAYLRKSPQKPLRDCFLADAKTPIGVQQTGFQQQSKLTIVRQAIIKAQAQIQSQTPLSAAQSDILIMRKAQVAQLSIVHNSGPPVLSVKRGPKGGRYKRLMQIKEEKIRFRDLRELVLPINVTKLTSPFMVELMSRKMDRFEKQYSTSLTKKGMRHTEYNKFPQTSPKKSGVGKPMKEIYQREFAKHRFFYEIPLSEAIVEQANFLNIESIKPASSEERRKSMMLVMDRRYSDRLNHRIGKAGDKCPGLIDLDSKNVTTSQILVRNKTRSPLTMGKSVSIPLKPFKPPFQKYFYRDFLWKVGFGHGFMVDVPLQSPRPFRVYIGPGNNRLLIKSILKQRSWWAVVEKNEEGCHFVWSQLKVPQVFANQRQHESQKVNIRLGFQEDNQTTNKILNPGQETRWNQYLRFHKQGEEKLDQQMSRRNKYFPQLTRLTSANLRVHNHLENNYVIGNKKALFKTMSQYYHLCGKDVFQYLPVTFHIQNGTEDPEYSKFLNVFCSKAKRLKRSNSEDVSLPTNSKTNAWIVKPGQFTNRGAGIQVCLTLEEIRNIVKLKENHPNGNPKTYIVQTYLDRPLLYNKRKFDIRHYMMISSLNGVIRGYWYSEGYLRTTSFEYRLSSCNTGIHLTNDAIQKYLPEYGKYEKGNKLSYSQLQLYIHKNHKGKSFFKDVYPRMKQVATDAIRASYLFIDRNRREHNFEIFGMDFMIDDCFTPWLIEINTNPCLELSCPLLAKLIPEMVQNALTIGLDPLFPPPVFSANRGKPFKDNTEKSNQFQLVFDSTAEGQQISQLYGNLASTQGLAMSEDEQVFEDEGKQLEQ